MVGEIRPNECEESVRSGERKDPDWSKLEPVTSSSQLSIT